jgi:glycine/D-amino acid oxidase-like deaminating enzyme
VEDCQVKEILTEKQRAGQYDRVTSAVTSQGNIKCDVFINCTGSVKFKKKHSIKETSHLLLVGSRTWI